MSATALITLTIFSSRFMILEVLLAA
jgi:hypothetical protein